MFEPAGLVGMPNEWHAVPRHEQRPGGINDGVAIGSAPRLTPVSTGPPWFDGALAKLLGEPCPAVWARGRQGYVAARQSERGPAGGGRGGEHRCGCFILLGPLPGQGPHHRERRFEVAGLARRGDPVEPGGSQQGLVRFERGDRGENGRLPSSGSGEPTPGHDNDTLLIGRRDRLGQAFLCPGSKQQQVGIATWPWKPGHDGGGLGADAPTVRVASHDIDKGIAVVAQEFVAGHCRVGPAAFRRQPPSAIKLPFPRAIGREEDGRLVSLGSLIRAAGFFRRERIGSRLGSRCGRDRTPGERRRQARPGKPRLAG